MSSTSFSTRAGRRSLSTSLSRRDRAAHPRRPHRHRQRGYLPPLRRGDEPTGPRQGRSPDPLREDGKLVEDVSANVVQHKVERALDTVTVTVEDTLEGADESVGMAV